MDSVKGLCERLERRADQAPTRFHWQSAELREAATALTLAQTRIRELETALNGLLAPLGPNGYVLPAGAIATERARQTLKEAPNV